MGNINHEIWYGKNKRKIVVLGFDEDDVQRLGNYLIEKTLSINHQIGYLCEGVKHKDLNYRLWVSKV